jgi:hypothetical protein
MEVGTGAAAAPAAASLWRALLPQAAIEASGAIAFAIKGRRERWCGFIDMVPL